MPERSGTRIFNRTVTNLIALASLVASCIAFAKEYYPFGLLFLFLVVVSFLWALWQGRTATTHLGSKQEGADSVGDSLDPAQQARLAEYADRLDRYSKNLRSERGYSIETEENLLGKIAKVAIEIKDDITHTMEKEKLAKHIFKDVDLEGVDLHTRRNRHKICSDAELVVKRLRGLLK